MRYLRTRRTQRDYVCASLARAIGRGSEAEPSPVLSSGRRPSEASRSLGPRLRAVRGAVGGTARTVRTITRHAGRALVLVAPGRDADDLAEAAGEVALVEKSSALRNRRDLDAMAQQFTCTCDAQQQLIT